MASHIERLIEFLEKQIENNDMPKMLLEDIEWAIEVISANKLYSGNLDNIKFNQDRPEIKAWMDKINLISIPISEEEQLRLEEYEDKYK
jgi:hypothetical protein